MAINYNDIFPFISEAELDAEWKKAFARHLEPSQLFRLAQGMIVPTEAETNHLFICHSCNHYFERYRT